MPKPTCTSRAAIDRLAYGDFTPRRVGAAPTRPRCPRRPGQGGLDVVPSAHTGDVATPRATADAARPAANAPNDAAERAGRKAELLVEKRVRAALPERDGYRVFANVAWTGRTRDHGQVSDGEADLVIAHPERGFLVIETKAGEIRRDAEPPDVIVCDSIRRFKGLERAVVILCELKLDDPRLARLLYIGGSRAKQHLVVIEPPAVVH
jgi:UvrD-like helicase family protein/nuclease-like protein